MGWTPFATFEEGDIRWKLTHTRVVDLGPVQPSGPLGTTTPDVYGDPVDQLADDRYYFKVLGPYIGIAIQNMQWDTLSEVLVLQVTPLIDQGGGTLVEGESITATINTVPATQYSNYISDIGMQQGLTDPPLGAIWLLQPDAGINLKGLRFRLKTNITNSYAQLYLRFSALEGS